MTCETKVTLSDEEHAEAVLNYIKAKLPQFSDKEIEIGSGSDDSDLDEITVTVTEVEKI